MSIDTRVRRAADGVHASARGVNPMTQLLELKEESRSRRREGLVVAAVAVVVVVVGGLFASARWLGSDEASDPVVPAVTDDARAIATDFLDARNDHDADRAMSYMTDAAIAGQYESAQGLRETFGWERAVGWTEILDSCDRVSSSATAVTLRCGYSVHAIGSQQSGIGPYGDSYWDLTVRDGKIASARATFPFNDNGFSDGVWEPFGQWVSFTYPEDAAVMYKDSRRTDAATTPESLRLWEQHIQDYVDVKTGQASQ